MVTDASGNSYVDSVSARYLGARGDDHLVLVRADGSHTLAASVGEHFPNGVAISTDGSTLLMACTFARQIAAMDIQSDGKLTNFRFWASTGPSLPDGICIDEQGGLWFGAINTREFCRVVEGGEVTHTIPTGDWAAIAPALGGADRNTFYGAVSDMDGHGLGGYEKAASTWPGYAADSTAPPEHAPSPSDRAYGVVGAIVAADIADAAGEVVP
jgi:sugar lactone lactonase YvrE